MMHGRFAWSLTLAWVGIFRSGAAEYEEDDAEWFRPPGFMEMGSDDEIHREDLDAAMAEDWDGERWDRSIHRHDDAESVLTSFMELGDMRMEREIARAIEGHDSMLKGKPNEVAIGRHDIPQLEGIGASYAQIRANDDSESEGSDGQSDGDAPSSNGDKFRESRSQDSGDDAPPPKPKSDKKKKKKARKNKASADNDSNLEIVQIRNARQDAEEETRSVKDSSIVFNKMPTQTKGKIAPQDQHRWDDARTLSASRESSDTDASKGFRENAGWMAGLGFGAVACLGAILFVTWWDSHKAA